MKTWESWDYGVTGWGELNKKKRGGERWFLSFDLVKILEILFFGTKKFRE